MFFASYCGVSRKRTDASLIPAGPEEEADLRSLSVREAVNFAKSTNLLGVILEATTLVSSPSDCGTSTYLANVIGGRTESGG